ncbi:Hypothetical protein R9X50_00802600 [Acrodontium crateriforme]|uniref:Uncharacterized protein n=1 Tax=Acrodontium crateriforme TaxID=150365 RepID=A0AAQ3MC18_9PEZI|nr:Hypothetical protein R9X50_00802600 [Acrodontium crateriforme]
MAKPSEDQCLDIISHGAVLQGDSDISGPGVILAFIISAYITFAVVLGAYVFGMVEGEMLNMVDTHIFRVRPFKGKHPHIHAGIRKAVLSLSDQQIVTGIAIMGAGFQGLRTGSISTYHFQIVLYLAWMSSSVHLSALTLLRPFLMDHKGVKTWRLVGMLVLLVLLFIGLVPTVSNDWGIEYNAVDAVDDPRTSWATPAICFWTRTYGDGVNADAILGWVILIGSYVWKVGDLYKKARLFYLRSFAEPVDRAAQAGLRFAAQRYADTRQHRWLWLFRALLIVFLPITALMEIASSFTASLWVAGLGLIFGTFQIAIPRILVGYLVGSSESSWGFGQLTPLILLIQPLGAVSEVIWVRDRSDSIVVLDETDWNWPNSTTPGEPRAHDPDEEPDKIPFARFILSLFQRRRDELAGHSGKDALLQAREEHAQELLEYIYKSWLFKAHIIFTQLGIAAIAAAVFAFDAKSIGSFKPQSWYSVGISLAGYLCVSILITVFCIPFSRLGSNPNRNDENHRGWSKVGIEMKNWRSWKRRDDDHETTSPLRKHRSDTMQTSRPGTALS